MNCFNCSNRCLCTLFALIASLIIGVIAAFLQITAVIAVSTVFFWVAFGIAVAYLALLLITRRTELCDCICFILNTVLVGLLGTILTAAILLLIGFAATSVIGAIFVGLLAFFFSLTITATACLVKCAFSCPND